MDNITVRKACADDLDKIQMIYAYAREFMRKTGNPNQWKDNSPSLEDILGDIKNGTGFVIELNGKICGVFAFILGEDPTYKYIEDGEWLSDEPYAAIHRIASDGSLKGIVSIATQFAEKTIKNIKIDTYKDNKIMQHVLDKLGFKKCGTIYLENGEPRIAYQRVR